MKLRFLAFLVLGILACGPAAAAGLASGFPAPEGLRRCAPSDEAAIAEARVASQHGGEFLGCFKSERTIMPPGAAKTGLTPAEYAFALAIPGDHTQADLEKLLSTVRQQWKTFDPLIKEFKENYTARLNDLIKNNGSTPSPTFVSVKPVLVSIDRPSDNYYLVTSIRTYVFELAGRRVNSTKVNSDALALRGSQLVRLTIQRTLSDPTDVSQVQDEIAKWAQATVQSPSRAGQ